MIIIIILGWNIDLYSSAIRVIDDDSISFPRVSVSCYDYDFHQASLILLRAFDTKNIDKENS